MKADFHFHFYSRIVIMSVLAVVFVFSHKSVETGAGPIPAEDITGWAWSENVGWISLNCYNDFDEPGTFENHCSSVSYGLKLGDNAGDTVVTGCAWAGSYLTPSGYPLGWICFSDPGATQAPTFGIATSTTYVNALSSSAYASILSQEHYRCSISGDICGTGYPACPGVETCQLVADDAWKLGFPIDEASRVSSVADDIDYPGNINPINGCFNCHKVYSDYICANDPATSCDGVCSEGQDSCEESTGLICPEVSEDVYDTCQAQTLSYNCDNCLEYFYWQEGESVDHEAGEFKKVLGGYDCTSCTVENFDNVCGLNAYAGNVNRCAYCADIFKTPGVMVDHKYYDIGTGESAALCGWAYNDWGTSQGLGWIQFEPRVVTTTRPYISIEEGSLYSKGRVYSRYAPPFSKYSASYLIESGDEIINFISGKTLSGEYQGELPYSPSVDFFDLQDNGKYENALGSIDYYGLITKIDGNYNKYGSEVVDITELSELLTELNNPLGGNVIRVTPPGGGLGLYDTSVIEIESGAGNESGAGIIVIEGNLFISTNIEYNDSDDFANLKNIPNVVWLVRGDVYVGPLVDSIAGTFIILGNETVTTCGQPSSCDVASVFSGADTGCGQFTSCIDTGGDVCGQTGLPLTVNGSVIARLFELCRGYYDPAVQEPAEKFINDGRLQSNPPPGFTDFSKVLPRFY